MQENGAHELVISKSMNYKKLCQFPMQINIIECNFIKQSTDTRRGHVTRLKRVVKINLAINQSQFTTILFLFSHFIIPSNLQNNETLENEKKLFFFSFELMILLLKQHIKALSFGLAMKYIQSKTSLNACATDLKMVSFINKSSLRSSIKNTIKNQCPCQKQTCKNGRKIISSAT